MIANAVQMSKDARILAALRGDWPSLERVLHLSQTELRHITGQRQCILPDLDYEVIAMEAIEKMLKKDLASKEHPWSYYCKSLENCFYDQVKKMNRRPICQSVDEEWIQTRVFEPNFTKNPQKLAKMASSCPNECLVILTKMYGLTIAESFEIYGMASKVLGSKKLMCLSSYAELVLKTCEASSVNPYFRFLSDSCSLADLETCISQQYPRIYHFLLSKLQNIAA